eukprot:gnl/Spiro4/25491_TR12714_c0_g1_i1.p1 gnl/Spiro4/25491_TR12714_c0_g1~~gnl/Spiro4/25491_TR12714_c0_g1_i1.p1  ORF type:complete len:288 (-),score=66.77 gnl/Spiro4/25491_TR12714_c0_g1_i1:329-1144(-)
MCAEFLRKIRPLDFHLKFLSSEVRADGRTLHRVRNTTVSRGVVSSAEGSALVRVGSTSVLCGVKAEIGSPSEKEPGMGRVEINTEISSMCSPKCARWKDSEQAAAVVTAFLSVALLESGAIDRSLLYISPQHVWVVYVDVYCLDRDGNLTDAALLAAVAALHHLSLPVMRVDDSCESLSSSLVADPTARWTLDLHRVPVSLTFALIQDYLLSDPTEEEQEIASLLIVVVDTKDNLLSVYKPGGAAVPLESLKRCIDLAKARKQEVLELLGS